MVLVGCKRSMNSAGFDIQLWLLGLLAPGLEHVLKFRVSEFRVEVCRT